MKWGISRPFQVRKVHIWGGNGAAQRRRGVKASVNLQLSSFATRHRLSKLISALGLASVATAEASASPRSVKISCTLPSEQAIMPA